MSRLLLLLFAGLKFGKLLLPLGTMLITMGVYALMYGWRYAAGILFMLVLHEMGHYIAARQRGIEARLPKFTPFVAWTSHGRAPNAETEAYIALGGPLLGTVGAIAAYYLGLHEDSQVLVAVSYTGFFLNLINLIPLPPLDGGRITAVLSPRIWLLGVPVLGMMLWYRFSPIFLAIGILALPYLFQALRHRVDTPEAQAYYQVSERTRWEYAIVYIGLLAYLGMMTHDVDRQLRPAREQRAQQVESV